jgi:hypothetical protein
MRENRVRGFFRKKMRRMVGQALLSLRLQRKKEFIQILHQEMVVITTAMKIERMRWSNRNRTVIATVEQLEAHFC